MDGDKHIKITAANSNDVIVFCFVARTRNFSRAAKELGISRSLVSKRVSRLEDRLNTRLVQRSTRSMSLTEAGDLLYRRYSDITERIARAEREVSDLHHTHSGLIRLAAPTAYGYVGMSLVSRLQRKYPNIEIELCVEDGEIDMIRSAYDAAIHVGPLRDSNLICRKVRSVRLATCASPEYLAKRGMPGTPRDLKRHNCLTLTPGAGEGRHWRFRPASGRAFSEPVGGDFSANNEVILLRACLAGMGICQLPMLLVREHLDSGELRLVLEETSKVSTDIYVVLPHRDVPEKVRVAVDFLTSQLRRRFPQAGDMA